MRPSKLTLPGAGWGRLVAWLLVGACLLGWAAPVAAHAVLLEASPGERAQLATSPTVIRLRFNEPVSPVFVRLLDRAGHDLTRAAAVVARDDTLQATLPRPLADGAYLLSWRVLSADAHPVGGAWVFVVGRAPAAAMPARPAVSADDRAWRLPDVGVRWIHLMCLFAAAGGGLFLALVSREPMAAVERRLRTRLRLMTRLGVATAALGIVTHLGSLLAAPLPQWRQASSWPLLQHDTRAVSAVVVMLGLLLGMVALRLPPGRWGRSVGVAAALVAIGGLALTGHAAGAPPAGLSMPLFMVHVLAVGFWLGALWPLSAALASPAGEPPIALVQRFSRMAVPAVAVLLVSGAGIAAIQLGDATALTHTAYGRLLLGKLGLVLALLGVAAWNRQRLTPALATQAPHAARALRRAIVAERGMAGLILLVVTLMGQQPPPRALAEQAKARQSGLAGAVSPAVVHTQGYAMRMEVAPAQVGENRVVVVLSDANGVSLAAPDVRLALSAAASGGEALSFPLHAEARGRYAASDVYLPLPGPWNAQVDVLVSDFDQLIFRTAIRVR